MGAKRNSLLSLAALGIFVATGCLAATAQTGMDTPQSDALSAANLSERDAESAYFSKTLSLALEQRPTRLISTDDFVIMGTDADTIILDTRSAEAYAKSHIADAINLPLTEMTELSLALTLPSRTVPILIYSHENIGANTGPIRHDSSDLSLNLMSFLALSQYGYTNVYELGERIERTDTRLDWTTTQPEQASLEISVPS